MKKRLIALTNGTGMGGELIVFSTNAPKERLQALEKESCDVILNGGDMEDVPLWYEVLEKEGYVFSYEDSHSNISVYGTSAEWLEDKYLSTKALKRLMLPAGRRFVFRLTCVWWA